MTRPILIGIGGRLTSGKDTVADHLVAEHGFVKLGMSDPLLEAALVLNPIVGQWPGDTDLITAREAVTSFGYVQAKAQYSEFRDFLQRLGTDFGRKMIGSGIWVDMAAARLRELADEDKSAVITGLRYPNEVEMIRRLGGRTWWVERDIKSISDHTSENSVDSSDFDITIDNNGTLEQLFSLVDALYEGLTIPQRLHGVALTAAEVLELERALKADFPTVPITLTTNERHAA